MSSNGNGPVRKLGPVSVGKSRNVSVAIWSKVIQANGKQITVFSVSCQESYYDDGQWKQTQSFRPTSLLVLARLLQQAFDWTQAQQGMDAQAAAIEEPVPF